MDLDALLSKATDHVSAGRAFGPVIERDDCLVIPAAWVMSAGGGGGGGDNAADHDHAGHGGGAGHYSLTWPVGAYVVRNGEAKWVPAFDATRVALAAVLVVKLGLKLRAARRLAP